MTSTQERDAELGQLVRDLASNQKYLHVTQAQLVHGAARIEYAAATIKRASDDNETISIRASDLEAITEFQEVYAK